MIAEKTVLILGAGASKPFGFPTGTELKKQICLELLNSNGDIYNIIENLQVKQFVKDLKQSRFDSVDAFLEAKPKYEIIGKQAIAAILLQKEAQNESLLLKSGDWYQSLFNILTKDCKSFDSIRDNKITILTYNYDRTLEYYLFTKLSSLDKTDQEIKDVLENLNIIHLHGSLGKLPWQGGEYQFNYTKFKFKGNINNRAYRDAIADQQDTAIAIKRTKLFTVHKAAMDANEIKIIYEVELNGNLQFQNAIQALREAENVYFFGFGFSKTNLERLDYMNWNNLRRCAGTTYGINAQTKELLKNISFGEARLRFEPYEITCYDFLSDVAIFK